MVQYMVQDKGELRKYRTEIPNSIDDMDLSVYAFRLYVHLKRVAGDSGMCWQSTDTLAKSCHMSAGMISKAKEELKARGLILIETQKNERGGRDFHHITIVDIWIDNLLRYTSSPDEQASSLYEVASSPHEQASSPHELKKEPIKKEPVKNERDKSRAPDPRSKHPAIQLIHGVTGHYPPTAIYDLVISRLGDSPDGPRFAKVNETWLARGNKPTNLEGQLDWYDNGIPDYKPHFQQPVNTHKRMLKGADGQLVEDR